MASGWDHDALSVGEVKLRDKVLRVVFWQETSGNSWKLKFFFSPWNQIDIISHSPLGGCTPSSHPEQFNTLGIATLNIINLLKLSIRKSEVRGGLHYQVNGNNDYVFGIKISYPLVNSYGFCQSREFICFLKSLLVCSSGGNAL